MSHDTSNGCGWAGELSMAWQYVTGKRPPFELCCDEHDVAYEQAKEWDKTISDFGSHYKRRKVADKHFLDCMKRNGHPIKGYVFYGIIRAFGWLAWWS